MAHRGINLLLAKQLVEAISIKDVIERRYFRVSGLLRLLRLGRLLWATALTLVVVLAALGRCFLFTLGTVTLRACRRLVPRGGLALSLIHI